MDIVNSFIIEDEVFYYYDIKKVIDENRNLRNLPIVLKILLESNLRKAKTQNDFNNIIRIFENRSSEKIRFIPSRLILEEFTELPIFIDLASIRDEVKTLGGNVNKINPNILVDLIIDNSFMKENNESIKDYTLNEEKYYFIKWALHNFTNLRVIPPGSGMFHHVNLEFLSTILHIERKEDKYFLYPETVLGTNSQTTMANSLGVLGFRIDSIEAQLAILGLPIFTKLPKVVGIKIDGIPNNAISSSDIVSTLIKKLQSSNLDGKLVEFFGEGLTYLTLEDRSTVSIAAPKYGSLCSYFAIDNKTIKYFNKTRGNEDYGKLIKTYLEKQNMFFDNEYLDYDEIIDFDLSSVYPDIKEKKDLKESVNSLKGFPLLKKGEFLSDGDIVYSVINTVELTLYHLIHSLLVIKKALEFNLKIEERVNGIFIIDSIKKEHLQRLKLLDYIEMLGFNILLDTDDLIMEEKIGDRNLRKDIIDNNLNVCSISSCNINLDIKDSNLVKSNYITSSSLVVFFSIIGNVKFDFDNDVIKIIDNKALYLKDIWPSNDEVISYLGKIDSTLYKEIYKEIYKGDEFWQNLKVENTSTYNWDNDSTYIQPTKFPKESIYKEQIEIKEATILALFGDNISTEDILPSKQIPLYSPVSKYLEKKGVKSFEYNTFESRCGNPEIMIRTLFSSPNVRNLMISKEGGFTLDNESGEIVPIYKRAMTLNEQGKPSVILAGKDFGKGVSKYWAVKGLKLLGIEVILANSFDNQYRENLINFGILPLEFIDDDIHSLKLKGKEKITIDVKNIKEKSNIDILIQKENTQVVLEVKCRLDTYDEVEYYKKGGVLNTLYFDMIENSL